MNFKKFLILNLLYTTLFLNSSLIYANNVELENDDIVINNEEILSDEDAIDDNLESSSLGEPSISGYSAVLVDANTGIVLYDKNMNEKLYPASMTKVMTVILALEYGNLDETITHSHNAVFNIGPGSSHIGMRENEEITLEDALYAMLLASANEVCMAVAEHISGSVEAFVEKMNEKAQELGAVNTHFANPHGFHDENHYTTSYDMSLIMREAIKYDKFNEVISTETYTIPETNIVDEQRILNNTNRMIKTWSNFYHPNVIGGKTGFTDEAGNTLTIFAKNGDISLVSVIMKDTGTDVYVDTAELIDYGFTLYEEIEIFNNPSFTIKSPVVQTFNDTTIDLDEIDLTTESSIVTATLPKFIITSDIKQNVILPESIEAPVAIGDVLGKLELVYQDTVIGEVNLVSSSEVELIPESSLLKKEKIKNFLNTSFKVLKYIGISLVILIVALILITIINNKIKRNRRKRMRFSSYNNSSSHRVYKKNTRRRF